MRKKLQGKLHKHLTPFSMLVSQYKVSLDEKMIIRAVKTNQTDFLYCIWAYNKNYEKKSHTTEGEDSENTDSDQDEITRN